MLVGWAPGAAFEGAASNCRKAGQTLVRSIVPRSYFASTISREKILFTIRHSPPYFTNDM
jgi:hypothetical protein